MNSEIENKIQTRRRAVNGIKLHASNARYWAKTKPEGHSEKAAPLLEIFNCRISPSTHRTWTSKDSFPGEIRQSIIR